MIFIGRLVWEEWNIVHIARHNVIPQEVEEVCHNDPIEREGKKGRIQLIGLTRKGRILSIILDPEPEPNMYYPVTAHPASRQERRAYRTEKGGEKAA
jgi:uncharacterized protein